MTTIILLPFTTDFATCEALWARRSEGGVEYGVLQSLDEVSALALSDEDEIAVIAPGSDIILHGVNVPARADSQARLAASFALEDEIAVDREAMVFALGPQAEAGWNRPVAIIAQARLEAWLDAIGSAGIRLSVLAPDFGLLPKEANTLSLVERGGRILVRLEETTGFAVEPGLVPQILGDLLAHADVRWVNIAAAAPEMLAPEGGWGARAVTIGPAPSDDAFAEFALDNIERAREINFCQGAYAPRRSHWKGIGVWKRGAALAAAIFLAYLGLLGVEGWRYSGEAERREARAETLLRTAFPDIEEIVNARAQLRARLSDAGGGNPDRFFDLTAMVFSAANPLPDVEIQGMQFDALRGDLAIDIAFRNYPSLEQLKTAIADTGGNVEEGGSRQQGEWIVGEIRVAQR